MSGRHLTTSYRPQTFAQVLGQEAVKTILSKAVEQGEIAPAYMFSGTRGVGKTTVARILAKAINCAQAPAKEPCNKCHSCLQITRGASLDVQEIDGASHTGVDNIRKLNEEITFSPIESRYKVIIIDEAHMLSKSAFNALLKTLEEPPGHAVFILATTEPHRFPATIISRCQHFVFQRIPQRQLEEYLAWILDQENVAYESAALSLLAKKGAGSVRDSLSLLSQMLALREEIDLAAVQKVFGLAGQEVLDELFGALWARDTVKLVHLVRGLLDQGLDLAFFLQDFSQAWRNVFIIQQIGYEQASGLLDLPQAEARMLADWADKWPMTQVHASWQLTLEAQKSILTNPDPGLALELLFFNLAFLPELLPLSELGMTSAKQERGPNEVAARPGRNNPGPLEDNGVRESRKASAHLAEGQHAVHPAHFGPLVDAARQSKAGKVAGPDSFVKDRRLRSPSQDTRSADWSGFLRFIRQRKLNLPNLATVHCQVDESRIVLNCLPYVAARLEGAGDVLNQAVEEYFGSGFRIEIKNTVQTGGKKKMTKKEMIAQAKGHPLVQEMQKTFQAKVVDVCLLNEKD